MNPHPLPPNRVFIPLPLETAREAAWEVLTTAGASRAVIDVEKNIVAGSTRSNLFGEGQNVTFSFLERDGGTLISVQSEPQQPGTIDFGKSKRNAARLAVAVSELVANGWPPPWHGVELVEPASVSLAAPIATPTGEISARPPSSGPIYGTVGPWPRGRTVLTYGIFGIICCQIAAPFAVAYGIKALREYGPNDPGDKASVIVGLILGILGSLLILFWLIAAMIPNM